MTLAHRGSPLSRDAELSPSLSPLIFCGELCIDMTFARRGKNYKEGSFVLQQVFPFN
jgi:hypothetical protein